MFLEFQTHEVSRRCLGERRALQKQKRTADLANNLRPEGNDAFIEFGQMI